MQTYAVPETVALPEGCHPQTLAELRQLLGQPRRIAISTHIRPDGDAIGSCLAVLNHLAPQGHSITVLLPSALPANLAWLKGMTHVRVAEQDLAGCEVVLQEAEVLICLDYGHRQRAGLLHEPLTRCQAFTVHLDHHLELEPFARVLYRDVKASSTCELCYHFLPLIHPEPFSKATANCLYLGIMTDTGSFRFPTATEAVHQAVAHLITRGVDVAEVHNRVFNTFTESRLRILGYCLTEGMHLLPELHTAYMVLPLTVQQRYGLQVGDTEGIVNYGLGLDGINLAVIIIEQPGGGCKLSFRSVGQFSANALAGHFQGGGHYNASGGQSPEGPEATEERLVQLLNEFSEELNYNPYPLTHDA